MDTLILSVGLGKLHRHPNVLERIQRDFPVVICGLAHPQNHIHPQFAEHSIYSEKLALNWFPYKTFVTLSQNSLLTRDVPKFVRISSRE